MHRRLRLVGLVLTTIAIAMVVQTPASAEPVGHGPDPRPGKVALPHAFSAFPGYYQLINKRSNKCLEVQTPDGFYVHQWSCLGSREQAWQPYLDTDGYYELFNLRFGPCLTGFNGWIGNGVPVVVQPCGAHSYQQWQIIQVASFPVNYYAFKDRNSGKCLNISGGSFADGAPLIEYDCVFTDNEMFAFS